MAHTQLAYPDVALNYFSGTDLDQDAESFIQLIERRSILISVMHLQNLKKSQPTLSGRKHCSCLYSEDEPLSGTRVTSRTLLYGKILEQTSSLDFQMDETTFDTEWKWNSVSEEMERNLETFYSALKERLTKTGPMT